MFENEFDYKNVELRNFWSSYSGEFKNNVFHGLGTLVLSNQEKFLVNFCENNVHGEGTFYKKNGEIIVGIWKDNKFIEKN